MFRWIAILAVVVLATGEAYGQSASPQPTLPLGQGQMMGHMNWPMMNGALAMDPNVMPMMQLMQSGVMGPYMQYAGMMGPEFGGFMCAGQTSMPGVMRMTGSPASRLEARLAFTRSELAITPAQDAAWQTYAVALRGQVQPMAKYIANMQAAMMDGTAFPVRFDARIALVEGQLANLKAVREAAIALYGKLDNGQKQTADALLPMSSCM
jgi:hypothetical protein